MYHRHTAEVLKVILSCDLFPFFPGVGLLKFRLRDFIRAVLLFLGCYVLPAAPFDDAQCIGLLLTHFLRILLSVLPQTGYDALLFVLWSNRRLTGRISSKCPFDCLKCFFCGFSVFSSFPTSGKPCPNS